MMPFINTDPVSRITLQGHDPVAFHTHGQAIKGDAFTQATYQGAVYLFVNQDSRAAFMRDPERYLPAYGGYCAFGVAHDLVFPVEIDTWQLIEGRLVLNFSHDVRAKFDADPQGYIAKAEESWPRLGATSS